MDPVYGFDKQGVDAIRQTVDAVLGTPINAVGQKRGHRAAQTVMKTYTGPWAVKDVTDAGVAKVGISELGTLWYWLYGLTVGMNFTVHTTEASGPGSHTHRTYNTGKVYGYDVGGNNQRGWYPGSAFGMSNMSFAQINFKDDDAWEQSQYSDDFFNESSNYITKNMSSLADGIWAIFLKFGDQGEGTLFSFDAYCVGDAGTVKTDVNPWLMCIKYGSSKYSNNIGLANGTHILAYVKIKDANIVEIRQRQYGPVCAGMARYYHNIADI